jgi:hypothetical protein
LDLYGLPDVSGFSGDARRSVLKSEGYRIRRIRPRCYRRELTANVWVRDEDTGKIERSSAAKPVMVSRPNKVTGEPEDVLIDEVNSVPAAWHYLPSAVVVRLVKFLRRNVSAGLTACERRWAACGPRADAAGGGASGKKLGGDSKAR